MGTRSNIGLEEPDGTILFVYCHWNGYPAWNGAVLQKHYADEAKIRQLLDLGDISSLRQRVEPPEGAPHSFGSPQGETTVFYHRDRGEDWESIQPRYVNRRHDAYGQEYAYIWVVKEQRWVYQGHGVSEWTDLATALEVVN